MIVWSKKEIFMKYGGALPGEDILNLISSGFIVDGNKDYVRCGSMDPVIGEEGYRVNGAFLPRHDETVVQAVQRMGGLPISPRSILECGCVYVFRLKESISSLPRTIYGGSNPKSSSGRIDVHVRLLTDRVSRYDTIPIDYVGSLWVLVIPKTFPVVISPGTPLNQIRFFNQDTRFDEFRLEVQMRNDGGLLNTAFTHQIKYEDIQHTDNDGSLILSLGLSGYEHPGFEAVENGEPIDMDLLGHYDPRYFFRPILVKQNSTTLHAGTFYILSTKQYVRVPSHLACEMVPMDERTGDLRSHYAGFIDPGWGIGATGTNCGRPLTLEVRSFDTSLSVCDGQPIAKIRYERMKETPARHYDQMSANYSGQYGPKFAKFFKEWE